MAPLTACIEFCTKGTCERIGCSYMEETNKTAIDNYINDNTTAINATRLPCTEQIVLRLNEVPFAVCFVIILILCFAIIVYAIAKKRLYRNGIIQTCTA